MRLALGWYGPAAWCCWESEHSLGAPLPAQKRPGCEAWPAGLRQVPQWGEQALGWQVVRPARPTSSMKPLQRHAWPALCHREMSRTPGRAGGSAGVQPEQGADRQSVGFLSDPGALGVWG